MEVAGFITILAEGGLWMKLDREETRKVLRELPSSEVIYAAIQKKPTLCVMLGVQMEAIDTYELEEDDVPLALDAAPTSSNSK